MNASIFRRQLADSADHLAATIARAALTCDPQELEILAIQLRGTAMLSMRLRDAILTAPATAGPSSDDRLAQANA